MTRAEAREILGVYRPGTEDADDPFFAEALKMAAADEELARWFVEEQAFDNLIAEKLAENSPARSEAPETLLAALSSGSARVVRWDFRRALALAAGLALLASLATWLLLPARESGAGTLAAFRSEMVTFVKLPPALDLETSDLAKVRSFLENRGIVQTVAVPGGTDRLPPLGCRALMFRGHRVALICFEREDGELVHLLIADRDAMAGPALTGGPQYAQEGEWSTAAWNEGDRVYMLATKGGPEAVRAYL